MPEAPNGRNMNGTVLIPNPSVMTIDLVSRPPTTHMDHLEHFVSPPLTPGVRQGNITLDLSVAGQAIGQSYLDNLTLKPGNNLVPMTSTVNQTAIINMMVSDSNPYKDGVVPFDITGNSSVYHGEELPYFTEALSANHLTVDLNVTKALAEIGVTNL